MDLTLSEFLRYSNEEREKWRAWFLRHPAALDATVQPGGRFDTVGRLIDHIFLSERCDLQRLMDAAPDERTGLSGRHVPPLFDYGASVRRELEQFACDLEGGGADEPRAFTFDDGTFTLSPRKFLFHILVHEVRHWAQIALAVRLAGFDPPGRHDFSYSRAMK